MPTGAGDTLSVTSSGPRTLSWEGGRTLGSFASEGGEIWRKGRWYPKKEEKRRGCEDDDMQGALTQSHKGQLGTSQLSGMARPCSWMEDCKCEPLAYQRPSGGCLLALSLWPTGRLLSFQDKLGLGESGEFGIGWERRRVKGKGLEARDPRRLETHCCQFLCPLAKTDKKPLFYCVNDPEFWVGPQSYHCLKRFGIPMGRIPHA